MVLAGEQLLFEAVHREETTPSESGQRRRSALEDRQKDPPVKGAFPETSCLNVSKPRFGLRTERVKNERGQRGFVR
jgi:hypothetical protein